MKPLKITILLIAVIAFGYLGAHYDAQTYEKLRQNRAGRYFRALEYRPWATVNYVFSAFCGLWLVAVLSSGTPTPSET